MAENQDQNADVATHVGGGTPFRADMKTREQILADRRKKILASRIDCPDMIGIEHGLMHLLFREIGVFDSGQYDLLCDASTGETISEGFIGLETYTQLYHMFAA